jgi:hypothetical protein
MKVIIDHFEDSFAVCETEDKSLIDIEILKLPLEAKQGDVLEILGDHITLNQSETNERKKRIQELMKDTWEN